MMRLLFDLWPATLAMLVGLCGIAWVVLTRTMPRRARERVERDYAATLTPLGLATMTAAHMREAHGMFGLHDQCAECDRFVRLHRYVRERDPHAPFTDAWRRTIETEDFSAGAAATREAFHG